MELVLYVAAVIFTMCRLATEAKSGVESGALTDVSSQSDENACFNFSVGNPHRKEFYSPNYPNEYPNNIKCTFRITADVGHMVMLDFRDIFDLENTANCEYDRLEVRDGAYGYSPLIGKFCGTQFPKKLYSSKRYMWLHFSSDDSIPHKGFRAVYDYVPIPNQGPNVHDTERECAYYRSGSSGLIQKSEIDPYWQRYRHEDSIECMWTIETEAGKKLYLNFNKYRLERPNDCDQNFIQIFGSGRTPDQLLAKFCGTTAEPQKSTSNLTHVRLFAHRDVFNQTDFVIHYTAFREIKKEEQCDPKTEFNCGDQTCVDIALKCDGEFDCKYRYDEETALCSRALGASIMLTSDHMIIILVVFFSLVVAMCASISVSCYNKIKERQLREREYKERRSKEASVEATLDRALQPPRTQGPLPKADDDQSSDGGCYVPEPDTSAFRANKARTPTAENTSQKKGARNAFQQQNYPYISESFESLSSDVIVPPAPPPVPLHKRERSQDMPSPPAPTYRIVGGRVVAQPPEETTRTTGWTPAKPSEPPERQPLWSLPDRGPRTLTEPSRTIAPEKDDPKAAWIRGPLEAGAPRSAYNRTPTVRDPKQVPLTAFRGPFEDSRAPSSYRLGSSRGYPSRAESDLRTEPSDSSRAHSVASTLSAPDAVAGLKHR